MATARTLAAGGAIFATHRYALRNKPNYAAKLYDFAKIAEDRSPHGQFRTFRFSEALSSNAVKEVKYSYSQLVRNGEHTDLGATIHRLSKGKINVHAEGGLHFSSAGNAPGWMSLVGGPNQDVKIRFTSGGEKGSTMGGASQRYHAPLGHTTGRRKTAYDFHDPTRRTDETWWEYHRRQQNPTRGRVPGARTKEATDFFPTFSKIGTEEAGFKGFWNAVKSKASNADRIGFEMAERFQHLMSQMGLGLKQGSYNKFAHVPFMSGKWGDGGFVNEMLLRRVLPAYAGYKALQWADYHLGHKPSQMLAAIPPKARVAHAELTDRLPFARSVTDFYANVAPGSQYGALALPGGGAFIGGIYSWTKRLRDVPQEEIAKVAQWKWAHLPEALHVIPGAKYITEVCMNFLRV